jgi:tetratricopeptide (TPR) repeat protein
MARSGKVAASILSRAFARHNRAKIYPALCLLAALFHFEEFRGEPTAFIKTGGEAILAEPKVLSHGAAVADTISAGETRVYALGLPAGQHALVEMIKGDLRVKVSVCAPPGRDCVGLAAARYGRLELPFTAGAPGQYEIEVRSVEADAAARGYELRLVSVTEATPRDRLAGEAARTAAEAEGLRERQDQPSQLDALKRYDDAQRLWEEAGELSRATEVLCDMGDVHFAMSQYRQASTHYTKALSLGERSGDPLALLAALHGAGYVNIYFGDKQQALSSAQKMLDVVERAAPERRDSADYRRARARALNIMGEVYYSFGQLRKSIEMFDQALPLWTDAGERSGQALALLNLGYSYSDLGNPELAAEYFQRALALWQSIDGRRGAALTQTALGGTHSTLGEEQLALNLHKQAADYFGAVGDKQGQAAALNGVASVYHDLNEHQSAFDNYFEALRLYEAIESRDFIALNKFLVGRILYQKGESESAFKYYQESLDLSREVGDRVIEADDLQGAAQLVHQILHGRKTLLDILAAVAG